MGPLEHTRSPRISAAVSIILVSLLCASHFLFHLGDGAEKILLCPGGLPVRQGASLWRGTQVCDVGSRCGDRWKGGSQWFFEELGVSKAGLLIMKQSEERGLL